MFENNKHQQTLKTSLPAKSVISANKNKSQQLLNIRLKVSFESYKKS